MRVIPSPAPTLTLIFSLPYATMVTYRMTINQRILVTVDVLVFSVIDDKLRVLLIERDIDPFKNMWALPGGFVKEKESLDEAAARELEEETGIKNIYMEQLYTFGDVKRDPRDRVVSIAYFALVAKENVTFSIPTFEAKEIKWAAVDQLPPMAFDHRDIIEVGIERIKSKLSYSNIAYGLLPSEFRLSELQKIYEIILNTTLDKRNFRKKILSLNILESTGKRELEGRHRPAMLYRFTEKKLITFDSVFT